MLAAHNAAFWPACPDTSACGTPPERTLSSSGKIYPPHAYDFHGRYPEFRDMNVMYGYLLKNGASYSFPGYTITLEEFEKTYKDAHK